MSDPDPEAVVARDRDDRPIEIHGPQSEVEALVRKASPARLVLRLLLSAALLGAAAVGVLFARDAWAERRARTAPMAHVPGGPVRIGNPRGPAEEKPEHEVSLAPFSIDLFEVTVAGYGICVKRGRCTPPQKGDFCNWGKEKVDDHPINCVDHEQAAAYCAWLGKRLPSEKEWEHAARGADGRRFPWGKERPSPRLLNVCGTECRLYGAKRGRVFAAMYEQEDPYPLTSPVGTYPEGRSPYGLYDVEGNVREWTSSPYCPYPHEACGNEQELVIRGAGWANHFEMNVEVTTREAIGRHEALEALGFRCAR